MRERSAIGLAVLVMSALVGLSGLFARSQNPGAAVAQNSDAPAATPAETVGATPTPSTTTTATPSASLIPQPPAGSALASTDSIRGRVVFDSVGCARCHSAGGVGSPRYPLDGVGARKSDSELRAWVLGADVLADSLPPSALRTKQSYRAMRPADIDALVTFLRSLKR